MELLAPAGGMEQLRFALHYGADAVYLAGERFGLRTRAENFPGVSLASAVSFVHQRGKKVYVTANSLLHEGDLSGFCRFLETLEELGVDAAIVSDLGAIPLLHKHAPHVGIHISTQASVANSASARMYADLGASRIVLARELTLEGIAALIANSPKGLEFEAFVHGAMCIAYSGRCLISNYLVGRDANRGSCTQPCRWKWSLQEETRPGQYFPIEEGGKHSFIMSSSDLCMIDYLENLKSAGVDSLKIEGRVKGAYYVATIVNAYRQVLDGCDPKMVHRELNAVSHRPYHSGFYFGNPQQSYDGQEYQQDCDFIGYVDSCRQLIDGNYCIRLTLRNRFFPGDCLEVLSPNTQFTTTIVRNVRDAEGTLMEVADHTGVVYSFECDKELRQLDILRKRRMNPVIQAGR